MLVRKLNTIGKHLPADMTFTCVVTKCTFRRRSDGLSLELGEEEMEKLKEGSPERRIERIQATLFLITLGLGIVLCFAILGPDDISSWKGFIALWVNVFVSWKVTKLITS